MVVFLACIFGAAVLILYGHMIELRSVTIQHAQIRNSGLATALKGEKIVLISDLHLGGPFWDAGHEVLEIVEDINPDIIFLAGDYVDWSGGHDVYNRAIEFLSRLKAPLGVFGVMGNADYITSRETCKFCHTADWKYPAETSRVNMLRNTWTEVTTEHGKFVVAGIDSSNPLTKEPATIPDLPDDLPVIMLSHTSDLFAGIDQTRDVLVLAGDTHGGQILLPEFFWKFIGAKSDPDHMRGLYQEGKKFLFVTSGIGYSHIPIRIGVPPEVVILEFLDF